MSKVAPFGAVHSGVSKPSDGGTVSEEELKSLSICSTYRRGSLEMDLFEKSGDEWETKQQSQLRTLPPERKFHYFMSHKKAHSVHATVPEQVAKNFHDCLEVCLTHINSKFLFTFLLHIHSTEYMCCSDDGVRWLVRH
jgi:hypothetical protein